MCADTIIAVSASFLGLVIGAGVTWLIENWKWEQNLILDRFKMLYSPLYILVDRYKMLNDEYTQNEQSTEELYKNKEEYSQEYNTQQKILENINIVYAENRKLADEMNAILLEIDRVIESNFPYADISDINILTKIRQGIYFWINSNKLPLDVFLMKEEIFGPKKLIVGTFIESIEARYNELLKKLPKS